MALDITGKIIQILPLQSGSGRNGEWKKQNFVIETFDKFPRKICFQVWNEKTDNFEMLYPINSIVEVSFNLESREYNGSWYTDARVWKITPANPPIGTATSEAPVSSSSAVSSSTLPPPEEPYDGGEGDNLPF